MDKEIIVNTRDSLNQSNLDEKYWFNTGLSTYFTEHANLDFDKPVKICFVFAAKDIEEVDRTDCTL